LESTNKFNVEVAYALPDSQAIVTLEVEPRSTIEDAIIESGILETFPEIDLKKNKVGIFGKLSKLGQALRPGDRIEIYRPLIADPKEVRRQRAAQDKKNAAEPGTQAG